MSASTKGPTRVGLHHDQASSIDHSGGHSSGECRRIRVLEPGAIDQCVDAASVTAGVGERAVSTRYLKCEGFEPVCRCTGCSCRSTD